MSVPGLEGLDALSPQSEASTRQLAVELALHSRARVLELGCGAGRTACQLAREKRCEVVATDHDPAMLDRTLGRVVAEGLPERVDVRFADARTLLAFFPRERFDAVYAERLATVLGIAPLAAQARALLRPGGTFAFTMPTWQVRDESQVPSALVAAVQALFPAPVRRLDPNMAELADQGFSKGFAYLLPEDAWRGFCDPLAARLEALRAAGPLEAEAERYARELDLFEDLGPSVLAWTCYGGFADDPAVLDAGD